MNTNLDELTKLSPEEVEDRLVKEAEATQQDPAEVAATLYTLYLPRFLGAVDHLSARGKARVLKALIQVPLDDDVSFPNDLEREVFAIGDRLLQAKFMLIQASFMDHSEELQKAVDINHTETPEENKGE